MMVECAVENHSEPGSYVTMPVTSNCYITNLVDSDGTFLKWLPRKDPDKNNEQVVELRTRCVCFVLEGSATIMPRSRTQLEWEIKIECGEI